MKKCKVNRALPSQALRSMEDYINSLACCVPAYNLLDNSDFRNPVNQRGGSSYSAPGYSIDRWYLSGAMIMTINDRHVSLVNSTSGTVYLEQRIPLEKLVVGNTYTVAVQESEGVVSCGSFVLSDDSVNPISKSAYYVQTDAEENCGRVQLRIRAGCTVNVAWIALYEGEYTAETLPTYMPKGYAAELAECMRYFYILKASGSAGYNTIMNGTITNSGKSLVVALETGTKMRLTAPTTSFSGTVTVRGVSGYSSDATYSTPYENPVFTVRSSDGGRMGIEIKKTDETVWADLTNNTLISVTCNSGSILTMSADL